MSKKVKMLMVLAFMIGSLGGLAEYFSPSVRVDDNDLFDMQESVEASSLAPTISAEGAILINAEDGSVIYEKNADKRLYPASTTKIMTALISLEIMDEINAELDSEIKVPKKAVGIEGSSLYLKEGEFITAEELLYGTMLQSGNDGATALAISIGGNMSNFVERMNNKAVELGCRETNFVNPSGLFDKEHYTTARDLALISKAAMETQAFREIVSSKNWSSDTTGRSFTNKNKTIAEYDGATGVKIGYTKKSGRTLVASAKRGDTELIAVVLNAPNWFQDAYALLDYGFARDN